MSAFEILGDKTGLVPCINTDASNACPPFGVMEIMGVSGTSSLNASYQYRLRRPTSNSLAQVAFFAGGGFAADAQGFGLVGYEPVQVAYDADDGDPDVGDEIGTKSGSFLMSANGSGWLVLAVDTDEEVAVVRKTGSGGIQLLFSELATSDYDASPGAFTSDAWTVARQYDLTGPEKSGLVCANNSTMILTPANTAFGNQRWVMNLIFLCSGTTYLSGRVRVYGTIGDDEDELICTLRNGQAQAAGTRVVFGSEAFDVPGSGVHPYWASPFVGTVDIGADETAQVDYLKFEYYVTSNATTWSNINTDATELWIYNR